VSGFDLILMDVQMPELYGDDVANALRAERDVRTPMYLFSTLDDSELERRAREAQIEGYISKQRGMDHLVAEVAKIFAKQ
jgi:response regulator RpfG family c-di-GMP phosphodiesterase